MGKVSTTNRACWFTDATRPVIIDVGVTIGSGFGLEGGGAGVVLTDAGAESVPLGSGRG